MIVSKFGGTSVGSFEAMQRCASIIHSDTNRKLIIISATSGTTNDLVALGDPDLFANERENILFRIEQRHLEIIDKCQNKETVKAVFERDFASLREHMDYSGRDKRWQDKLMSFGEIMSTHIFVEILKENGVDAVWLDAREVIRTDSQFSKAVPDRIAIRKLAEEQIDKSKVTLTQGFIGSDKLGNTTTLGRGGSDFSASLFAEAVDADTLEIWTDVAGVYTTDPRVVPDAHPISEITFSEAAELSVFGGKVLHPATLKPAIRSNIDVHVLSSAEPDKQGTWILTETKEKPSIRAMSLRKEQTLLTLNSLEMLGQSGFLAHIFKVLADHGISVDLVTTSEVSVALTLDTAFKASNKVELSDDVIAELSKYAHVKVERNLALIALIGNDLSATAGISGPLFNAMEHHNIRLICHGASNHNLCFLTEESESEEILRMLHKKFIN
ncbi:lysine-sensitive aspartokinase 3 [Balneola sp. MJW-20]|uniref:lysine-sensitive aspartokinase 3 n=1 Tax=Gracilimonas aurantiaca TaxID=3234185 RepID=UPI0034670F29